MEYLNDILINMNNIAELFFLKNNNLLLIISFFLFYKYINPKKNCVNIKILDKNKKSK